MFFLFGVLFYNISQQYTESYCAALRDKIDYLESIEEAKIVILGDSNVAFGINSEMIEEELGMPVVNMGLHANLGNAFHEQMAKINVKEGDIYVICHEDYADTDVISDPVLAWTAIENKYKYYKVLRKKDIWPMMKAYPTYLKKCIKRITKNEINPEVGKLYSRGAFNAYGDVEYPRDENNYEFTEIVKPSHINDITVSRINELYEWLYKRGATLVIAGYPIGKGDLTVSVEEFEKFQEGLEKRMNCEVISDYKDYMFDYSYFYDTHLHLTDAGTELRTKQLISDLRKWMQKNKGLKNYAQK